MKEIINNILNNQLTGVIIGWALSSITTIFISNKEKKERRKEEYDREKRRRFENKAELRIEQSKQTYKDKADIELFIAPFKVKYGKDYKDYSFVYPKEITDKKEHKYKDFYIKNIGKSDINYLDICVTYQEDSTLIEYNQIDSISKGHISCSVCYNKKILKGETVLVRLYYHKKYQIVHTFNCTLVIVFEDSYRNLWEQSFWYEYSNLEPPHSIDYKAYRSNVTLYKTIDCIENPSIK